MSKYFEKKVEAHPYKTNAKSVKDMRLYYPGCCGTKSSNHIKRDLKTKHRKEGKVGFLCLHYD